RRRFRKVVASGFKALTPQAQAVAAPVEDLETVCGAVAEDEQVAAERVGFQTVLHQGEQAIEAQTHVHGVGTVPQLDTRRHGQHGRSPSVAATERTKSRSQPGIRRRTRPPGKTTSTGTAAGRSRTGTKRAACSPGGWRRRRQA